MYRTIRYSSSRLGNFQWDSCFRRNRMWMPLERTSHPPQSDTPFRVPSTLPRCWYHSTASVCLASNKTRKRTSSGGGGAVSGRVTTFQKTGKIKEGQVKLCTGCGAEVRRQGGRNVNNSRSSDRYDDARVMTGEDTLVPGQSKKQIKQSRFVEAVPRINRQGHTAFLCERCLALQSNNVWRAYDALKDVSPTVFAQQLQHIVRRRQFGLCLLVVDGTDAEHSAMKHLRQYIGKTPCWLLINKIDLLPRLIAREQSLLASRIGSLTGTSYVNTFAVSAVTGQGLFHLAEKLLSSLQGKDVFVIGAANVGKSTLVQQLATMIADAVLAPTSRKRGQNERHTMATQLSVTGSHLPGTTLQAVRIPCFPSQGHALWDTPGIINRKALTYSVFPVHFMEALARPLPIPLPSRNKGTLGHWQPGFSLLIEASWMMADLSNNNDNKNDEEDDNVSSHDESSNDDDTSSGEEDSSDDDDDSDGETDSHMNTGRRKGNRMDNSNENLHLPCVLGRIDLKEIEQGDTVYTQAYLHPSLNVRIVPTHLAPDHATIPDAYVDLIHLRMRQAGGAHESTRRVKGDEIKYSLPLKPFSNPPTMPNGEVTPGDKEFNPNYEQYYMDIVFASLGWISLSHNAKFTVVPHCVEGSVFSKRPALYPTNLPQLLEHHKGSNENDSSGREELNRFDHGIDYAMTHEELSQEEMHDRLRDASNRGRHQTVDGYGGSGGASRRRGGGGGRDHDSESGSLDEDDEWY